MRRWVLAVVVGMSLISRTGGAQENQDALKSVGQQAVHVVLTQYALNPDAVTAKTGKALGGKGKWSIGNKAPAACPATTETCVAVFYDVPEDGVSCQWVVKLNGEGDTGEVLSENSDAQQYMIRKMSRLEAIDQVVVRKLPIYPAIAQAAHVQGRVVLWVEIDAKGDRKDIKVVSGNEMLRQSAVDATKEWKFKPFVEGSKAIQYLIQVTYDFRYNYGGSTVTSTP